MAKLHQPLDHARRQIRLMTIISTSESLDIRCSLEVHDMHSDLNYKALSYVWGEAAGSATILVNGHGVQIYPNLYSFLRASEDWSDGEPIWIDQICINQAEEFEKNYQVQMMGDIYSRATETICWLGPDPFNGLAFAAIERFHARKAWRRRHAPSSRHLWDMATSDEEKTAFEAMRALPYWQRHWIVQELILGTQKGHVTLLHGSATLAFKTFIDARLPLTSEDEMAPDLLFWLQNLSEKFGKSEHSTMWWCVCALVLHTVCKDPRDKVYGIQSLFPVDTQIAVNYNLSARDVFLGSVSAWLKSLLQSGCMLLIFIGGCAQVMQGMGLARKEVAETWRAMFPKDHHCKITSGDPIMLQLRILIDTEWQVDQRLLRSQLEDRLEALIEKTMQHESCGQICRHGK